MRKTFRFIVMVVGFLVIALMTAWASLAIYYSHLSGEGLGPP